jgi:glycosyltransferase involved in cell wall biosynthesis
MGSVAVIIPNRNYGRYLADAVHSAVTQTVPADEVIVVDGESSDSSHDIAYQTVIGNSRGFRWLSCPPRGLANARNYGISQTKCDFIIPLDADDWIEPDYIERCLPWFDDDVDVVAPALRWHDGRVSQPDPPFTYERLLERNRMFVCSMFRRTAWELVGGYDELANIHEDWTFWGSLAARGRKMVAIDAPLFHYRTHPGSLTDLIGNSGSVEAFQVRTRARIRAYKESLCE